MVIPNELINQAKSEYGESAIEEIVEYFNVDNYDDKNKSCSCPLGHSDSTPSFIWNPKEDAFHCFAKETKVITKQGVVQIEDIINTPVEIINGNGEWETVIFKSYGIQNLMKLTLSSNGVKKEIYATPEHEWIVQKHKNKIQTQNLKNNYMLERMWLKNTNDMKPDIEGMRHEFIYGDGYKVVNIEKTNRTEEVFCCETSTHSFVLEDFILTGNCFSCGRNFGILDLYLQQGMSYSQAVKTLFEKTNTKFSFGNIGVKSNSITYPHYENSENRELVEHYLAKRKISEATLDYCDVQQDSHGNIVFHFYDNNDVLSLVKYRPSHKIGKGADGKKEIKSWCQPNADALPILFNMNRIDTTQPLIITEGEIDCLTLIECGFTNTVSIPLGAQNEKWIEHNWDWLEQFSKIIVWADNDEAGIKMRRTVCNRLGTWRTFYVEVPKEQNDKSIKDANEVFYYFGKDAVANFINSAKDIPIENVTDLYDVGEYDIENAEGLYTGLKPLDDKIFKMFFGTFNIITGINSSGKSVLINQIGIVEPVQQGYDVFVFSGEMSSPMLKNWIELVIAGRENITMKNEHIHTIDPKVRENIREWYKGHIHLYSNPQDYKAESILAKMEEMARKYGTKVFLIDNLMMIDLNANSDNLWVKQKEFAVKLANFANKYNAIVNLVAHPRKVQEIRRLTKMDISGSGDLTNLAHIVFGIHRYTPKEKEGEVTKNGTYLKGYEPVIHDCVIDVFKNRLTGTQDFEVPLWFDNPSYRFYTSEEELWKRYKWDKNQNKPLPKGNPKFDGDLPL